MASSWVWRRKIVSDVADVFGEVIRKDSREVVSVNRCRKRWRTVFAEDGVEVLKELFTSCARLNLGRVVGLFSFIYKVRYVLFSRLFNFLWMVSFDFSRHLSACQFSHFSSQNCCPILLNQGIGFLVWVVQWQRGVCWSRTEQRWLL